VPTPRTTSTKTSTTIANCHFAILTSLCRELGLTGDQMPTIFDYYEHNVMRIESLRMYYDVPIDRKGDIKQLPLILMNGGSFDTWVKKLGTDALMKELGIGKEEAKRHFEFSTDHSALKKLLNRSPFLKEKVPADELKYLRKLERHRREAKLGVDEPFIASLKGERTRSTSNKVVEKHPPIKQSTTRQPARSTRRSRT
jgi:hypothetical protein